MPFMIGSDGGTPFPVLINNQSCVSSFVHLSDQSGSPPPSRHRCHYPKNHYPHPPHHPQYLVRPRHFRQVFFFLAVYPVKADDP